MSLNYQDEPDDAPSGAQFYGPETDSFVAGWYKYKDGQWYWSQKIHGSKAVWQEVSSYNIPTLSTDIFIVKTFPLEALQPDAEYLYHAIPKEAFENRCPPLTDLNWPPKTQEGNDVDS